MADVVAQCSRGDETTQHVGEIVLGYSEHLDHPELREPYGGDLVAS